MGILAAAHVCFSVVPALGRISSDFANYYVPARARADGRDVARLYEREAFDREARRAGLETLGSFVPHPPANALLLAPFARLDPHRAKTAWTFVLVLAYAGAFVALWRAWRAQAGERPDVAGARAWLALVALLPSAALANALAYGQPYPLLLLCLGASLWAACRGRWTAAGLLLAPVVALKLYGLTFLAAFVLGRRWRAAAGLVAGTVALTAVTMALLGVEIHAVHAREVLPASLEGRIQDPYSTIWQSAASLSRRLFEREPDLNPAAVFDRPALAAAAARAATVFLAALTALAAAAAPTPPRLWAIAACGGLAAAPLTATYHFVLLAVPVAVWLAESGRRPAMVGAVLGLYVFATSTAPHYFARWADGVTAPLAYPRLFACVALLLVVAAPLLTRRRVAVAVVAAIAAATIGPRPVRDASWERLAAGGYLAAAPIECGGTHAWLAIEASRYVVRAGDGTSVAAGRGPLVPRCRAGRVVAATPEGEDAAVRAHWSARFGAPARHARLSPDGMTVVVQVWRGGSWDIEALVVADGRIRPLAVGGSNEVEPSWSSDGRHVLFASDRGRGLGSTAIYRVAVDGR